MEGFRCVRGRVALLGFRDQLVNYLRQRAHDDFESAGSFKGMPVRKHRDALVELAGYVERQPDDAPALAGLSWVGTLLGRRDGFEPTAEQGRVLANVGVESTPAPEDVIVELLAAGIEDVEVLRQQAHKERDEAVDEARNLREQRDLAHGRVARLEEHLAQETDRADRAEGDLARVRQQAEFFRALAAPKLGAERPERERVETGIYRRPVSDGFVYDITWTENGRKQRAGGVLVAGGGPRRPRRTGEGAGRCLRTGSTSTQRAWRSICATTRSPSCSASSWRCSRS
jgi:hypothetical protein